MYAATEKFIFCHVGPRTYLLVRAESIWLLRICSFGVAQAVLILVLTFWSCLHQCCCFIFSAYALACSISSFCS